MKKTMKRVRIPIDAYMIIFKEGDDFQEITENEVLFAISTMDLQISNLSGMDLGNGTKARFHFFFMDRNPYQTSDEELKRRAEVLWPTMKEKILEMIKEEEEKEKLEKESGALQRPSPDPDLRDIY